MNPPLIIPSVGRIVHFVLPEHHRNAGEHRPAMIVRVWTQPGVATKPTEAVQLCVFLDGPNDDVNQSSEASLMMWQSSVLQDNETMAPRTWHAPEFVDQSALGEKHL